MPRKRGGLFDFENFQKDSYMVKICNWALVSLKCSDIDGFHDKNRYSTQKGTQVEWQTLRKGLETFPKKIFRKICCFCGFLRH